MSFLPDPTELLAIADRIADQAAAVRGRAHRLGYAAAASGWSGLAADAFRLEADDTIAALLGAADRLDTAAGALRRHAANVGQLLDLVRVLEQQAVGVARGALQGIEHGAGDITHDVTHLAHLVGI